MKRKVLYMVVILLGFLVPLRLCAQASYNVPANGNTTVHTCDAWIYDHAGPNSSYVNNCDGYMVIYPAVAGNMVSFVSGDYWIESSVYSGSPYDYVTIYNGVGLSGTVLAELYGTGSITTPITSTDPTGALTIRFVSDNSVVLGGFEFRVQCVYPIPMSNTPLSGCSFLWSVPVGTDGYNNQDLTQTICSDDGEPLSVLFSQFSLGTGDVLYVYDGNTTTAPLLGAFTGNTIPSNMISSGDCLTFYFERNSSSLNSSWVASINCLTCTPASTASGSPCAIDNIHPFCTGETQTTYYSGTTGNAKDFFGISSGYLGCLGIAQAPAWYFMRIDDPGDMTIHIEQHSSTGTPLDVDFACWGPFAAASTEDFVQNLCCGYYSFNTSYHHSNTGYFLDDGYNAWGTVPNYPFPNLVDCSYDPQTWEECHINNAQTGEYYLLLITNYAGYVYGSTGTISFSATEGMATTDCAIMAEVSNDGPYCVDDTIHLYCNNPQQGATYQWTGPGGWTSTAVNPVIYPATSAMSGTYTLTQTYNGHSSSASTTVEVISVNTYISVNPPNATICRGSSATLVGSSVTGYQNSYSWSTGQHTQQITVSPTTTTTYSLTQTVAGRCTGHATVAVNVHYPQHQSYYVDTCANSYSWHNHTFRQAGTYTRTWSHQDVNGCTQVDTLHLTLHSPSFTPPVDVNKSIPCAQNIQIPQQLPVITSCDNNVPLQLCDSINNIQNGCGFYRYVYHYTVGEVQYTWNYTYYLQPPSTFSPPPNQSVQVQCLADAEAPEPPVVVNACGDTIVPEAQPVVNNVNNCSGNVVYSWLYKDCLNHSKTWTYTYVIDDTTRPSFTVPADTYICWTLDGTYNADPSITGEPSDLDDNCSSSQDLTAEYEDFLHISSQGGADTLIRTWIVTDACDNVYAQEQHILIYPPDTAVAWEYICEGELYDEHGFSFVANQDTLVYQHVQSTQTGCDSVVKVFLTVWHPTHISDTVETCDSYVWHGNLYTSGGIKTYEHQDGNGCRQVDTLHLTLYDSVHVHKYDSACYLYTWDGNDYTVSGDYSRHFETAHGCDSVVTLHLTILGKDEVEFYKQRCFGYMWHDHYYDVTGDYTLVLSNRYGCDSVVTMHLSIQDTIYEDFEDEACNSYTWNDKIYYTTGDFEQIFNVFEGCDSLVTLHLTLYYDDTVSVDTFACESYTWNESTYTQSGVYEQHFFTEHGCDSLVQLNLTINHKSYSNLDSAICAVDFPFQWNGVTFNMPGGTDSTIIPNAKGCDSLITMHVTLNPNTSSILHDTIVQNALPYDTLGMHFTAAGRKQTTISNVYGCDSVVTMILTVLPNVQISLDSTVCENALPLQWNGLTFRQAGTQSVTLIASTKVDSTVIMHLNVKPNTYSTVLDTVVENDLPHTFNGIVFSDSVTNARVVIPNAQDCDSIITYSLFVWRNVEDTADRWVCDDYSWPLEWNGVSFSGEGEAPVVLTGVHGEDSTLLMRVHVNPTKTTLLQEEICMNDLPYRYINGQIDTTFEAGTPPISTLNFNLSTAAGCDSIVTLDLNVMDTSLFIVSSTDFCSGMNTTLSVVTSLEDYVWSTGETSSSIEVTEPGEYSVTASTGDCQGRAWRRIYPCKEDLKLPNAITPSNSDGLNDCFRLPEAVLDQVEEFEITIFNRWGQVVFYSRDKNFRWYGDYKGRIEKEEVYNYTLKYIDKDGIMFRMKGAITVL